MTNGKVFFDNSKFFTKNDIIPQKTDYGNNLKTTEKIAKVKQKSESISQLLGKVAVVAVASVTGVVGISEIMPSAIKAEFSFVEAFDTEVVYCVDLSEYQEGIKIILYNDFTNREQDVEEQITEGVFENLQTNMQYTLVVKHGLRVLAKQTLVTKTREEEWEEEPYTEPIEEDPTQEPNLDDTGQEDLNLSDEPNGREDPNLSDNPTGENYGDEEPVNEDDGTGGDQAGYIG